MTNQSNEMSVAQHNGEVASGLHAIAQNLSAILDTNTRAQETHDMVIRLREKMDNVELFMVRITKQLDDLPSKLDACYARKETVEQNAKKLNDLEDRAADKARLVKVEAEQDKFRNILVGFAVTIILSAVLIALGISDKVHL